MNIYIIYLQVYFLNAMVKIIEYLLIKIDKKIIDFFIDFIELFVDLTFYIEEKKESTIFLLSDSESGYESDTEDCEEHNFIKKQVKINLNRVNIGKYKSKERLICSEGKNKIINKYYKLNLKCAFLFNITDNNIIMLEDIKNKLILWSFIHNHIYTYSICNFSKKKARYLFLLMKDNNNYSMNLIIDLKDKKNVLTGDSFCFSKLYI